MQNKTGPYLRTPITIESVMIDVLISLVPPLLAGIIFFGWRALWIVFLSTVTAVVTEALLFGHHNAHGHFWGRQCGCNRHVGWFDTAFDHSLVGTHCRFHIGHCSGKACIWWIRLQHFQSCSRSSCYSIIGLYLTISEV